jgi:hypothetical protein
VGCLDLSLPVIGGSSRGLGGDAVLVAVGVVMRMVVVRVVFRFYSGDNHPRGGSGGGVGSVCFLPSVWRLFLGLDFVCVCDSGYGGGATLCVVVSVRILCRCFLAQEFLVRC